jgi:hypothetical protein
MRLAVNGRRGRDIGVGYMSTRFLIQKREKESGSANID